MLKNEIRLFNVVPSKNDDDRINHYLKCLSFLKEQIIQEIDTILLIQERLPDLNISYYNEHENILSSKSVNPIVNDFKLSYSCGCCNDSCVYMWPFIDIDGQRIFATGLPYTIGYRNYGNGIIPDEKFEEKMKDQNIPDEIIKQAYNHLEEHKPDPDYYD